MLEKGPVRATILREMDERPKTFIELLSATGETFESLAEVLETLISEGSIKKTSDGFQTLYFLPRTGQQQ
jgi:DNA-binding HxlR family transcriptional regulator